jgi:hypothetical protein
VPNSPWPVRRFVVVDRSMEPALRAGQGLIAVRSRRVCVGQIRVFEHPYRPGFWLVKRVGEVLDDGRMRVTADNTSAEGATDSKQFGPVPVKGSYRVVTVV